MIVKPGNWLVKDSGILFGKIALGRVGYSNKVENYCGLFNGNDYDKRGVENN